MKQMWIAANNIYTVTREQGAKFRERELIPALQTHGNQLVLELDGGVGYGSSWLEEVFGGLVRGEAPREVVTAVYNNIRSNEDPSLIEEIRDYIREAMAKRDKLYPSNGI